MFFNFYNSCSIACKKCVKTQNSLTICGLAYSCKCLAKRAVSNVMLHSYTLCNVYNCIAEYSLQTSLALVYFTRELLQFLQHSLLYFCGVQVLILPSVLALMWMVYLSVDGLQYTVAVIYGSSLLTLFTISTVFHVISYTGKFWFVFIMSNKSMKFIIRNIFMRFVIYTAATRSNKSLQQMMMLYQVRAWFVPGHGSIPFIWAIE